MEFLKFPVTYVLPSMRKNFSFIVQVNSPLLQLSPTAPCVFTSDETGSIFSVISSKY